MDDCTHPRLAIEDAPFRSKDNGKWRWPARCTVCGFEGSIENRPLGEGQYRKNPDKPWTCTTRRVIPNG